jgi:hypothetical protein
LATLHIPNKQTRLRKKAAAYLHRLRSNFVGRRSKTLEKFMTKELQNVNS